MPIWAYVLIAIGGLIVVLFIVVLLRAAFFKPKKEIRTPAEKVTIDKEKAVTSLQALIQCKTVSMRDHSQEDEKEFSKLKARLKEVYPHVFAAMDYQELSSREILFHLKGRNGDEKHPAFFMAHFDVVPAEESAWKEPAFEGIRKDGVLWGRGTIDTKGTLNGVLRGAEELFIHGEKPEHDFYFAFAGDEETGGGSAKLAVKYFQERGIEPLLVIDEGGAVVNKVFPGVTRPTALVGTAEKGACALEFHLDGEGGHASAPKPHTPVGKLASLAVDIEKHTFKYHLTEPVKQMFDTLGREAPFAYRVIFANLWLFNPLLDKVTKKAGGQLNALVRTTVALTQMQGSSATNVIPSKAMIGLNSRMMPPDNLDSVKARLGKIAKKHGIEVTPVPSYSWNPSRISTIDGEGYQKLKQAILGTWGDEVIVSPYMMTACADAREYGVISDKVYRFSPMKLRAEQLEMIHGDDEQLNEQQIAETVEFYYRLMRSL